MARLRAIQKRFAGEHRRGDVTVSFWAAPLQYSESAMWLRANPGLGNGNRLRGLYQLITNRGPICRLNLLRVSQLRR